MSHLRTARNPMSESRRWQVHGSLEPLADDRPMDWFDLACAAVCVVITVATIAFIWSQS
jgi:hypothetical protein